ncbi:hypothetical protein H5410_056537 [Solanum commersonii]|uniref:Uncharacterized protein n=1 Tax=Solanum commersonii TaxID=4109 RepID=A0A9J5WKI8_SOLCO|nr:hypothetical protein H5410_056537 [Solanum commersonii]
MDVLQDLVYGADWSRLANRPILNVKSPTEQTLAIELVGSDGKSGPFSKSKKPRHRTSVKTSAMESVGRNRQTGPFSRYLTSFLKKYFVEDHQDLSYGTGWSRWENRPIFKVKQTPQQISDVTFTKKKIVDARQDLRYRDNYFRWANQPIFKVKRATEQFFVDVFQDLSYGAVWFGRENLPIFLVKLAPERVNPLFCKFSCSIVHESFGDPNW